LVVQYTNRYTINKSMYRATRSGSDGIPFMAPDYKKAPHRGWYSPVVPSESEVGRTPKINLILPAKNDRIGKERTFRFNRSMAALTGPPPLSQNVDSEGVRDFAICFEHTI